VVGTAAGIRTDGAAHETYKETLKFEVQALRDGHVFLFVCLAVRLFVACNHTRQSPAYVSTNRYVLELIYLLLNNQLKRQKYIKIKTYR